MDNQDLFLGYVEKFANSYNKLEGVIANLKKPDKKVFDELENFSKYANESYVKWHRENISVIREPHIFTQMNKAMKNMVLTLSIEYPPGWQYLSKSINPSTIVALELHREAFFVALDAYLDLVKRSK